MALGGRWGGLEGSRVDLGGSSPREGTPLASADLGGAPLGFEGGARARTRRSHASYWTIEQLWGFLLKLLAHSAGPKGGGGRMSISTEHPGRMSIRDPKKDRNLDLKNDRDPGT